MAKWLEIYKCDLCGNVVEVFDGNDGELVCCGEPMKLMSEKTEDKGNEKHVPVLEKSGDTITVTVGSVEHPMEDEHFIQWIELQCGCGAYTEFLKPGVKPQAKFKLACDCDEIIARELCNVHGLWKGKM